MAELVGDREPLTFSPVVGVHDDEGNRGVSRSADSSGETAYAAERKGEYLHASLLQQLDEVGDGLLPQAPVVTEAICGSIRLDGIVRDGIGCIARLVPPSAREVQDVFDGEIPF